MTDFPRRAYGLFYGLCAVVLLVFPPEAVAASFGVGGISSATAQAYLHEAASPHSLGYPSLLASELPAAGTWALILLGVACTGVGVLTLGVRSGKTSRRNQRRAASTLKKRDPDGKEPS